MRTKPTDSKIIPVEKLLSRRGRWSRTGKRVVFTNGVFDILHPGHIHILETAASFGDMLVIGVNSDASTRRLSKKGPKRPVNPLARRMRILAALACVDAVVAFGENTPEKLVSRLKPDIMVKGGDYKASEVAGRQHAAKVVIVPLKKGHSTTAILQRLR